MLNWFDAAEAVAFGNTLADSYDAGWRELDGKAAHKQEDRRRKLVAHVLEQARQFGATHRLNFYKKAKLGNAFRWRLADLGHDKEVIEVMTKDILLAMR